MKKNKFAIIFFCLFVGATAWLFVRSFRPEKFPPGSRLPRSFAFEDSTGIKHIYENNNEKIIVVIFSTTCQFCKSLLVELDRNIYRFNNTRLYLISKEKNVFNVIKSNKIKDISALKKNKNVNWGVITNPGTEDEFETSSVPAIYVFSENKKLIKKLRGSVSIDELF